MATQLKVKKRDRERTKGKILKAVGEVIEQYGTDKVGVNLIARTAGVNKVLIYRYFGGVDGLMEQYVKTGQYVSTSSIDYIDSVPTPAPEDRGKVWATTFTTMMRDLRARKATRDLLRWEIGAGKSALTEARDEISARWMAKIGAIPGAQDTNALIAIVLGAVYYTVLAADYRGKLMDIDLQSEEGWERIEKALEAILTGSHK
ncbi:TetR/AcrR family transcriptional regulator [Telluribacter sp.]|jgi:AcrR family transcriptional regulator|uniref:TetR/AcrR family transcriptional regulator n=1 Tax=Telluribacter sp. TaxID=1978767 RepID=UPI002E0D7B44|nr:TetR/AcrR family transcriptional regulator [Telluribacter sp.]